MRYSLHRLTLALLFVVFCTSVHAGPPQGEDSSWRWTFQAAAVHQFEADLDKGGEVSVDRYFASLSATRQFSSRLNMGLDIGYGEDSYDFSGTTGFGALAPWGQIRELRISVPIRYFASREWALFALPSLRYQAEQGASLDDGQTGGLIAGAIYRLSDTFSIGPGLGVFSEIEDDASVFPILLIDWKITDTLSLETGGRLAASRGPGLQLTWQPTSRWRLALGGRYEKMRFRLDEKGVAPGGVGEDEAIPLYALAEYSWSDDLKFSFIGGAEVGGNLRLEDSSGNLVSDSDLDTAPFLGLTLKGRF
jgi:outer membrane receptor protein involved in Fe transport